MTYLRPTMESTSQQVLANITADQTQISNLQQQISSGKKVNVPSDNPPLAVQIMNAQASIERANQYVANAKDGLSRLQVANTTLNQAMTELAQAKNLALSISTASIGGSTSLQALAGQVGSIGASLLTLANTTYSGQAIFSGTAAGSEAFNAAGNYLGNSVVATRTVADGVQMPIAATGDAVFGSGAAGVFGVLKKMASDIQAGNTPAVLGTDLSNLEAATKQVATQAGQIGDYYQAMQAASDHATTTQSTLQSTMSTLENINPAEAISKLSLMQSSYQEALWAASQVLQPSLLKFLG
ncbi:MAG: flagellar hook-associated protein FlgL [Actinomycetota bacterium]|nr:flagellar hook-associated protein FlgL [Actinomycetota bacterium]